MRLLIITQTVDKNDPALGFFHRWIEEFAKNFESVLVVCLKEGAHTLPSNVIIFSLGKETKKASPLVYGLRFLRLIFRLRNKYDSVFVHMNPEYVLMGGIFWRIWRKKTALWYTHKSTPWYLRMAVPITHVIFTASKESFRLKSEKVLVVGHGVDIAPLLRDKKSNETIRLVSICRIAPVKNIQAIVDVYLELKKRGANVQLRLFGAPITEQDYKYKHTLIHYLESYRERPDEIFMGAIRHEKVPAILNEADFFLHASKTGSVDKAILEAVAAGVVPITSSDAYEDFFAEYAGLLQVKEEVLAFVDRIMAISSLDDAQRDHMIEVLHNRIKESYGLGALVRKIKFHYEHSR